MAKLYSTAKIVAQLQFSAGLASAVMPGGGKSGYGKSKIKFEDNSTYLLSAVAEASPLHIRAGIGTHWGYAWRAFAARARLGSIYAADA
jgi:hypothetical protein